MWAAYPFIQFMRWRLSSRQQVCDGGNQNLKEESKIKMSINPSEVMRHREAATVFKTSIKNLLMSTSTVRPWLYTAWLQSLRCYGKAIAVLTNIQKY